jgi:polyhydroxyalkanoate synthase
VWNYWVNNYLMGNSPPAFDILYWNNDSNAIAAAIATPIISRLLDANPFQRPERMALLGTESRLSPRRARQLRHRRLPPLTSRRGKVAIRRHALLSGERQFVLSSSGHIQSIHQSAGQIPRRASSPRREIGRPIPSSGWRSRRRKPGSWWDSRRGLVIRPLGRAATRPGRGWAHRRLPPAGVGAGTYVRES